MPTARVTDLGWQPTKGDIQRTDSGWQPIGATARHVPSSSVLPQARRAPAAIVPTPITRPRTRARTRTRQARPPSPPARCPQPSRAAALVGPLLLLPVLLLVAIVARWPRPANHLIQEFRVRVRVRVNPSASLDPNPTRWPRSANHLIQYVTGGARRANPRDEYVHIPLSPLHRQMLQHSAMRAPAVDEDCGDADPLLERLPTRTPSRRVERHPRLA